MDAFALTLSTDRETRNALESSFLYVLKVVSTTAQGWPLVWYRTRLSEPSLTIRWAQGQAAYSAPFTELFAGTMVDPGNSVAIQGGMRWDVDAESPTRTKTLRVIDIHTGSDPHTIGLAQPVGSSPDTPVPYCAFTLFPNTQLGLEPVDKIVLTFSTGDYAPGSIIGGRPAVRARARTASAIDPAEPDTSTASVVIDMTGAADNARAVSFSIMTGWSCALETWAIVLDSAEPVASHVIQKT